MEQELENKVRRLHEIFNNAERHSPGYTDSSFIPQDGLCITFEKGETCLGYDRIVHGFWT